MSFELDRHFDRIGRLVGDEQMERLSRSHVLVVGLGGVGSWAAEALVRTGVGRLTIVDFDEICVTNFNRQIHALRGLAGKNKAEVMGARMRQINPKAEITVFSEFYNEESSPRIFAQRPDYVVDAIDHVTSKCHLLAYCRQNGIHCVCSTGSGGRLDPTRIRTADLSQTEKDPLARAVRRILREKYAFPGERQGPFGIQAVYSIEPARKPEPLKYDNGQGFRCVCSGGDNPNMSCEKRNEIMGTAGFVTGAYGLACASIVVRGLLS